MLCALSSDLYELDGNSAPARPVCRAQRGAASWHCFILSQRLIRRAPSRFRGYGNRGGQPWTPDGQERRETGLAGGPAESGPSNSSLMTRADPLPAFLAAGPGLGFSPFGFSLGLRAHDQPAAHALGPRIIIISGGAVPGDGMLNVTDFFGYNFPILSSFDVQIKRRHASSPHFRGAATAWPAGARPGGRDQLGCRNVRATMPTAMKLPRRRRAELVSVCRLFAGGRAAVAHWGG